jgi:hypothetical protein
MECGKFMITKRLIKFVCDFFIDKTWSRHKNYWNKIKENIEMAKIYCLSLLKI